MFVVSAEKAELASLWPAKSASPSFSFQEGRPDSRSADVDSARCPGHRTCKSIYPKKTK